MEETPIAAAAAHAVAKDGETPVIPVASEYGRAAVEEVEPEVSVPEVVSSTDDQFAALFGGQDDDHSDDEATQEAQAEDDGLAVPDFLR